MHRQASCKAADAATSASLDVGRAAGLPASRRDALVDTIHGVPIPDPYRWLEDQNSFETRAWIDAQNRYTQSVLRDLPGRRQLQSRLRALINVDTVTAPYERGGRYFFKKRLRDQQLFVIYVRERGTDRVLIDPHPWSADHTLSAELEDISCDGKLVIYSIRKGGEDEVILKLRNVDTGKDLPDRLPRARYLSVSFKNDRSGFYYSRQMPEGARVFYHALGTDISTDLQIFGKGYGPGEGITANVSEDGAYLILQVYYGSAASKTEVYYQDSVHPGPILPLVKDTPARFFAQAVGHRVFLQTNWKAPRGRILSVDLRNPAPERWREIIHESDAVIEGFTLAGGRLLVSYSRDASSSLEVFAPDGKRVGEVALPGLGTVGDVNGRWMDTEAFVQFSSFHIPSTIYRYEVARDRQQVWGRTEAAVDSDRLEVKQVWYQSKDRTRIPMFLVQARDHRHHGPSPVLMTGYGGFDISYLPEFMPLAVIWAERGGIFALPSLRGGGEFGEEWHRAGMLEKKQNVFDDFIAAAEWLVREGYTEPCRLAIVGKSNGGLLVGAALTQRPDLYRAAVCAYPLLDMLRYQDFLVARYWVPEYGSSENADQFRYLYAYSPYHNVKPGVEYPAVLFMTGDLDTRVAPLHARKMTALLQWAAGTSGNRRPVLLHYDTKTGHSNGVPIDTQIEDMTDEISFLFSQIE